MGVFDFLMSAGQKLLGSNESSAPKADELKKGLDSFNLGTQGVNVSVEGNKVKLDGSVKDQSVLEKVVLAVGNTLGVAQVDTGNLKVENGGTAEAKFYTVKAGDTLWKIAESQYGKGHGDKHNIIFEANKPMLTSPDKIYPGQTLRIPPLS